MARNASDGGIAPGSLERSQCFMLGEKRTTVKIVIGQRITVEIAAVHGLRSRLVSSPGAAEAAIIVTGEGTAQVRKHGSVISGVALPVLPPLLRLIAPEQLIHLGFKRGGC